MNSLPQSFVPRRPPRIRLADDTPAVVRNPDGSLVPGSLQIVSLTGGLLDLTPPLEPGSVGKLMFLTKRGPILAATEMLPPVNWCQQPFRFTGLAPADQKILHATIESSLQENNQEQEWIEKYRAAVHGAPPPRRRFLKATAAVALTTLGLVGAVFAHFLR
ncbi:MAG: hypothetical protein JST79_19315 [Acidobacteria bacterium]|nr:hypothetical protein [Acidobacteriota bacterium]